MQVFKCIPRGKGGSSIDTNTDKDTDKGTDKGEERGGAGEAQGRALRGEDN